MSDYPRTELLKNPHRAFAYDRVFAAVRIVTVLYSSHLYFEAFHARWERTAPPGLSIFIWAPPLGSHLTTQIVGVVHGVFVGLGVWYGRGWAFAYTLLTALGACILSLTIHQSTFGMAFFFGVYVPSFLYCGLRLMGTFGPPVGGFELRRTMK